MRVDIHSYVYHNSQNIIIIQLPYVTLMCSHPAINWDYFIVSNIIRSYNTIILFHMFGKNGHCQLYQYVQHMAIYCFYSSPQ